jgi:hypothetical protein|tara:strand:+ start:109 stop:468 length:360 start_codon:yes stop_codon:yes gene_type:complete
MDQITLTFPHPIQVSVQTGDIAYYTDAIMGEDVVKIGKVLLLGYYDVNGNEVRTANSITCEIPPSTIRPTNNSFILFTKDNKANIGGILGYYAEVEMRCDSRVKAELFSIGTEIFESSK